MLKASRKRSTLRLMSSTRRTRHEGFNVFEQASNSPAERDLGQEQIIRLEEEKRRLRVSLRQGFAALGRIDTSCESLTCATRCETCRLAFSIYRASSD